MIQLYYAYSTFDEFSVLSLMGIMKDRILLVPEELYLIFYSLLSIHSFYRLHQSIKAIIDIIEDSKANEAKLNEHIMTVSRMFQFENLILLNFTHFCLLLELLLDIPKGQELMKNLMKLLKENVNLKNHFKSLVSPNCSCNKSLELIVSTQKPNRMTYK